MDKKLLRFFCAAFAASWLLWIVPIPLAENGWIAAPAARALTHAGTCTPSLLGLLFVGRTGGKAGIAALLRACLTLRPKALLEPAFFAAPGAYLLSLLALLLAGRSPWPLGAPLWALPVIFLYIFFLGGPLFEELGWRGYALPRMLCRRPPLVCAVLLGSVWAAWHLPLFFMAGRVQNDLLAFGAPLALGGYLLYTILVSILIAIVYLRAGNSVLAAMLMHTLCNFMVGLSMMLSDKGGFPLYLLCFGALSCAVAYANRRLLLAAPACREPPRAAGE